MTRGKDTERYDLAAHIARKALEKLMNMKHPPKRLKRQIAALKRRLGKGP
jgi:hypothetical protein